MIEEYLTEKLLREFVLQRFTGSIIFDRSYFKESRFRQDVVIEDFKLVLEFNGASHYTSADRIVKDEEKKDLCYSHGFELIEIPYFIQLDYKIITLLFSKYINNISTFNTYQHGFIDKKAKLPADFCTLGLYRFYSDLVRFKIVLPDIVNSLCNKSCLYKNQYSVYPPCWERKLAQLLTSNSNLS